MEENNKLLLEILRQMRIATHFEHKDRYVTLKLSDIQNLFIKLLELEKSVE